MTELMALRLARAKRDAARQSVLDWMAAEGGRGRLRNNSDAPGWDTYEAAERELDEARDAVERPEKAK